MEESAIREGFRAMKPMSAYDNLYQAALCRAQADWLIGMNATRLYSLLYGPTLHIGRVMSPTLAMLSQREKAIAPVQAGDLLQGSARSIGITDCCLPDRWATCRSQESGKELQGASEADRYTGE